MAAEKAPATAPATDAPVKKRRIVNRKPKILNALLGLSPEGKPVVIVASFNAFTLLTAMKQNSQAEVVEIEIAK